MNKVHQNTLLYRNQLKFWIILHKPVIFTESAKINTTAIQRIKRALIE